MAQEEESTTWFAAAICEAFGIEAGGAKAAEKVAAEKAESIKAGLVDDWENPCRGRPAWCFSSE